MKNINTCPMYYSKCVEIVQINQPHQIDSSCHGDHKNQSQAKPPSYYKRRYSAW